MKYLIAVIIIVVILAMWVISVSNALNVAQVKIAEADSDIDVALTKRYDVLTKMIDVVKGYTKYEQETLFKTVELRKNMSIQEKNAVNQAIGDNLAKINALAENYPNLKASESFQTLQKTIADVEEHLQASRRLYNSNVSIFNQMLVTFPSSIVAHRKGLIKMDFFVAEETKRQDVKIEF